MVNNIPRVRKFGWYIVYIGEDSEEKAPKEVAMNGIISTKMRCKNKVKKKVLENLKISEDYVVFFKITNHV